LKSGRSKTFPFK